MRHVRTYQPSIGCVVVDDVGVAWQHWRKDVWRSVAGQVGAWSDILSPELVWRYNSGDECYPEGQVREIQRFLSDCTEPGGKTMASAVYAAYVEWQPVKPCNSRLFSDILAMLGLPYSRTAAGRYRNVTLKEHG